jgi:hypothetical protein
MTSSSLRTWWFTSRQDGRFVVAQLPNPALAVWFGVVVWRTVADPTGLQRATLDGAAAGALIVWALDEVIRGINPFRRLLGIVVLVPTLVGLVSSLD